MSDQQDKPCADCGKPVHWLEVFPGPTKKTVRCIECHERKLQPLTEQDMQNMIAAFRGKGTINA